MYILSIHKSQKDLDFPYSVRLREEGKNNSIITFCKDINEGNNIASACLTALSIAKVKVSENIRVE